MNVVYVYIDYRLLCLVFLMELFELRGSWDLQGLEWCLNVFDNIVTSAG